MTKYCGTARDPSRRTLPWKPMVAMWCRPQPFGQPLILMRAPSAAAIEIRTRAQVLFEQPAEAARLRDRQAAGFRAGAARDVGDGARLGEPEPRGGQAPIQLPDVAGVHPPEQQILIGRHADRAVAVGARQLAEHAHLLARQIAERHARHRHHEPELLLRRARSCARQRAYASSPA